MTITTETCIVLSCTGCDIKLESDEGSIVHHHTIEDARSDADAYEWWTDGADIDMCEDCKVVKPHAFTPDPSGSTCARCLIDADDHDEESTGA